MNVELRRIEKFNLTTLSTHLINGYIGFEPHTHTCWHCKLCIYVCVHAGAYVLHACLLCARVICL